MKNKAVALGDKVEVSRLKFNTNDTYKNEKVYVSIIQDINDDEIIISAPVKNGKIIPLEVGASYVLSIYTNSGLYKCKSTVKNRYKKKELHMITLEVKSPMEKSQRRQYYRLECILPILFADINEDTWSEGLIVDISGGGLRFTSKRKMDANTILKCKIKLNSNDEVDTIELKGKVILSDIVDFEATKYETRIKFNISNEYREKIIKFIFEEERKRRKRKKGL
ncbi:flagellar brake protein [Vallitalea sp.]|jgi:c-di-GMP-binding flagellar brake protein YcgR|uniref:flagellar brake protein n=1 Tax=Vallitalea sp. TaxID=1882829 RepID=UPI0025F0BFA0|nr:flagellar brake protein [Vallitalea sp.]MCT4688246.1 flagellar brake protein [Vallitalea sp.]